MFSGNITRYHHRECSLTETLIILNNIFRIITFLCSDLTLLEVKLILKWKLVVVENFLNSSNEEFGREFMYIYYINIPVYSIQEYTQTRKMAYSNPLYKFLYWINRILYFNHRMSQKP